MPARAEQLRRFGRRHPLVPIACGVLLYSTGPVLVQASSVSGPAFSFWRLWFGVVVLGVTTLAHMRISGRRPRIRAWRWSVGAGLAFGAHQLLFFSAIKATSVVDVTLINTLAPIVTGILAVPVFQERPGPSFRLWSLVAMAGTAAVVLAASTGPDGSPTGMALAVGNVVVFAIFFLASKGSREHLDVVPFLFGVITLAAFTVSTYVVVAGEEVGAATVRDLLFAAIVAAGPGTVGHVVSTWPLRWVPANIPPVMRLAIPVLAATWAWWFLGEPVTVVHVVGGVVTVAGVAGAILSPGGQALMEEETLEG
ncbi:MAG: DMT family transporter [Actinomycetota bacterium]|nr:DMT family transporter [Actinomycetota bacterium]